MAKDERKSVQRRVAENRNYFIFKKMLEEYFKTENNTAMLT